MAKLSVCIITYNEEKNIGNCLESVKWADEIFVTDCESSDRTVEIAKRYPVKLVSRPNNDNLNINKQFGIEQATGDWVLWLDADESLSKELQEEIKNVISENDPIYNGYYFPIKNYIFGKWSRFGGNYPNYRLRLFRNGTGRFPCEHVHEHFIVEGRLKRLKGDLIHNSTTSVSHHLKKIDRNTDFEAEYLYKKNHRINLINYGWFFFWRPLIRFMQIYILKQGFRDGYQGLIFASNSAFLEFVRCSKLWEIQYKNKQSK